VHVAGGEPVALPDIGYGGMLTMRGRIRERLTLRAASAVTIASAPLIALPQRRLRPPVEAADLIVVSSRHEAGPLVALEAAAAGVPTVGTAVGHIAEWAQQAAIAVPVADPVAFARALATVLADEELRLRIAHEAWQRATLEDADHTAGTFQAIYTKLACTGSGRHGV